MPQASALSPGSLLGQAVITTAATPLMGYINIYNATTGPMAPILRQASLGTLGTTCLVEKDPNDASGNAVTITCHSGETFFDGTTTRVLSNPGAFLVLSILADNAGVARWKVVSSGITDTGALIDWAGGVAGVLPATSGQHLTTQGGNTLDDGAGNVVVKGGTLDGVTIGATTPATAITANTILPVNTTTAASGTPITMTIASTQVQTITGTTTNQIIKLPTTSVPRGMEYTIINFTSGANVTVQGSAGTTAEVLAPFQVGRYTALIAAPTGGFHWFAGNNLEGVTIGGTTAAAAITTRTIVSPTTMVFSGSGNRPWLNQNTYISGTADPAAAVANLLVAHDSANAASPGAQTNLLVQTYVDSPAVGGRLGITGQVIVESAGTNTITQAEYTGVAGHVTDKNTTDLGGTLIDPIGAFWGGWFTSATYGPSHYNEIFGVEIDVNCNSTSIKNKIGARIVLGTGDVANDTVRATADDTALNIIQNAGATSWGIGVKFGTDQFSASPTNTSGAWPFNNTSTIIGTSAVGIGLPANIGIDFSLITFTDAAIKTGPAPIQMGGMASPPATPASGKGKLYIAADGSLHYLGPTTDTEIAPA